MQKGEMSARGGSASGGETKETTAKCCGGMGLKHKRIFLIIIALIMLAVAGLCIATVAWKAHQVKNRIGMMYGYDNAQKGFGGMMNRDGGNYSVPAILDNKNQFVLPQDALKSGELAVVVSDLEIAKKAVLGVVEKNNGSVYATFIAYASNDVKSGSIVVQVSADNFNSAFDELKKIGSRVVQESTEQVAPRNFYPVPMSATEKVVSGQTATVENSATSESVTTPTSSEAKPEIAIYPSPIQAQLTQDKGYIKIVFVDYGVSARSEGVEKRSEIAGNILGVGQPASKNLIVIIGLKLIALIAIIGLLIVIFKKIFHKMKVKKENKKRVHIVRMMPKTRARVVRIAKRK